MTKSLAFSGNQEYSVQIDFAAELDRDPSELCLVDPLIL